MSSARSRRCLALPAALAAFGVASLISASPALGAERVSDGNFEAATCTPGVGGNCTSPFWTESVLNAGVIGPICQGGTDNCETQGSGYVTSPNWVRLGASALDGFYSSSIAQQVTIPAAPATLSFDLRILRTFDESASGEMLVSLDGTTVFGADNHAPDSRGAS